MIRNLVLFSTLTLIGAAGAAAQVREDSTALPALVVTATRSPVATTTLANGVTVIEGEALRRAGVTTLADALRTVPSLAFATAGGYGAQTSMFLRGGESDYVRVLVDGVPLNQAGGFIDLAGLTTENVERIEVVRGPVSVLYGSDAMTGVVQVITRQGQAAPRGNLEVRGGGFGSSTVIASGSAGGRVVRASAGVQREATSGIYSFNNDADNLGVSGAVTFTPDERTDLHLTTRYRNGTLHYPTNGSGVAVDSNQQQISRQAAVSLDAGRRLSSALEARLLLGYVDARDSTDDRADSPGDSLGIYAYESRANTGRRAADLRLNAQVAAPLLLTVGVAADRETEASQNSYQSSFGPGSGTTDVRRTNKAGYAQGLLQSGRLSVQGGVRLDDNEKFGSFGTWRIGASVQVASGTRLRANAGTAFKEPTFGENYSTGFSNGNPDLKPERNASFEAGLEQTMAHGKVTVSGTGFTQQFRDLIQYTFLTALPTDPNYYNVASAKSSGAEFELRVVPAPALRLSAQYTWLHTVAQDSGYDGTFVTGQPLLRRPAHSGSLSGEWRFGPARSLGARALYVGARDDLDFASFPAARVSLPDYGRLDLWGNIGLLSRTGGRALTLTVRAENVTGAQYQEILGYKAPGRRLLVGARLDVGR